MENFCDLLLDDSLRRVLIKRRSMSALGSRLSSARLK